eukprot:m.181513 g.181513  ORF g.181513 m.181513 type:complete len:62 (+) comp39276_c0_seq1:227-412(+)
MLPSCLNVIVGVGLTAASAEQLIAKGFPSDTTYAEERTETRTSEGGTAREKKEVNQNVSAL